MPFRNVKTLFLDADDTIWENNVYFLKTLDWLHRVGRELGHSHRATLSILNAWEHRNIARIGYGYDSYEASLLKTVAALVARGRAPERQAGLRARALAHTRFLRKHPIVLCPGVKESLPRLAARIPVIVVTKGHFPDQMAKVDRSGLKSLFHACEVVPHKYARNYLGLLKRYGLKAEQTVMIGNSPKSDINAAKRAGLRTIYVPHPTTWTLEMEPIDPSAPETVTVEHFGQVGAVLGIRG